jgi:predicted membrane protein
VEAKINPGSTPEPMTRRPRRLTFVRMKNPRISPQLLLGIALSAVFSLAIAHAIDLARFAFGSGPASPWAIAGSVAGLICCAASARYGLRHMHRQHRHGAC